MNAMPATCVNALLAAAASGVLTLVLAATVPGCGGPETVEVDKRAYYTPESLASELVFRYRALAADAKASTRKIQPGQSRAEQVERTRKVEKKGAGLKKKAEKSTTIDDVLDDINTELGRLKGMSRSDACGKMIDALSKDNTLAEKDKKTLTDHVSKMASTP